MKIPLGEKKPQITRIIFPSFLRLSSSSFPALLILFLHILWSSTAFGSVVFITFNGRFYLLLFKSLLKNFQKASQPLPRLRPLHFQQHSHVPAGSRSLGNCGIPGACSPQCSQHSLLTAPAKAGREIFPKFLVRTRISTRGRSPLVEVCSHFSKPSVNRTKHSPKAQPKEESAL